MTIRRVIRASAFCGISLIGVIAVYALVLAFPEPLFAHEFEYHNFRIYSRSPINPRIRAILDDVESRLARSEIVDLTLTHRIFVTGSPSWNAFFNGPYRRAIGRNQELGSLIFIPSLDAEAGRVRQFDGRSAEAASILAHEVTHTLVRRRIGQLAAWRLPFWKREGYAEYIGRGSSPDADECDEPPSYRRARMIWRHMLEVEHLRFDQIIAARVSEPSPL